VPPAEAAFSPLDEELELGPETFDPWLVESIVLLGTVAPFERVPLVVDRLLQVTVSVDTARRLTETIGRMQVKREDAEAERVRATLPMPETGPAVQQLSLDGAMVPLVGGAWAEVKTLALGEVEQTTATDGSVQSKATALSYFSRLTDAETFRELARGELHRRGTAAATVVCAVQDGAERQQRFVDHHWARRGAHPRLPARPRASWDGRAGGLRRRHRRLQRVARRPGPHPQARRPRCRA
jgi:hypothetical protein